MRFNYADPKGGKYHVKSQPPSFRVTVDSAHR